MVTTTVFFTCDMCGKKEEARTVDNFPGNVSKQMPQGWAGSYLSHACPECMAPYLAERSRWEVARREFWSPHQKVREALHAEFDAKYGEPPVSPLGPSKLTEA